jgi:hypothetical protein
LISSLFAPGIGDYNGHTRDKLPVGGLFEVAESLEGVTPRQASLSPLGFYFIEDVGEGHHYFFLLLFLVG